jgi:hypothetical protein
MHFVAFAVFLFTATIAHAQATVSRVSFTGVVGQNKIGMVLLVDAAGTVTGGHYFEAKDLKDIPLTVSTQGSGLLLYAPEGGQFALSFKGGQPGQSRSFRNSTGLEGRWLKGASSYPVELHIESTTQGSANARWYQDVTSESDAAFESKVQSFRKAVLDGDHAAAARFVDFPLRVNRGGKSSEIRSAAALSSHWDSIFTPACIDAVRDAMPHDMFVRNGQAMLGNGVVWFGPKGAQAINVP